MSAVAGIAQLLADAGVGAYAPNTPLPAGQTPITIAGSPPTTGAAVTVTTYGGGPEPDSRNGYTYPRLQVRVRHADPLAALDLDAAAFTALQFTPSTAPVVLSDGSTLTDCHALQSEAQPLGTDDNARWEFVRNYQLTVAPA